MTLLSHHQSQVWFDYVCDIIMQAADVVFPSMTVAFVTKMSEKQICIT